MAQPDAAYVSRRLACSCVRRSVAEGLLGGTGCGRHRWRTSVISAGGRCAGPSARRPRTEARRASGCEASILALSRGATPERPTAIASPSMTRPLRVGERVLLLDAKRRRYLVMLAEGGEFHSHAGYVPHADIDRAAEGVVVRSTKGAEYTVLRPTLEDFVVEMPRGAQVIYPKDLAPICMLADIGPGVRVFESGVGSGALSMTMLR